MHPVVIIGNGPAGISASLYTARAGLPTIVIGKDNGVLMKAERIENYYGFENPISGSELTARGIAQAKRLGVEIFPDEVVGLSYGEAFSVKTNRRELDAECVIISTGSSRTAPNIEGLQAFEGRGVSYCAVCDAYFYRNMDVAVLGCCEYAVSEAEELLPVARSVTLVTHTAAPISAVPPSIRVIAKEISAFTGGETLAGVRFADGDSISVGGVFVAVGVAGSADLAKKLGAQVSGSRILVDERMATSVPGLFAAGDCTGGMRQIAEAVYQGARAGTEAVKYLRKKTASL